MLLQMVCIDVKCNNFDSKQKIGDNERFQFVYLNHGKLAAVKHFNRRNHSAVKIICKEIIIFSLKSVVYAYLQPLCYWKEQLISSLQQLNLDSLLDFFWSMEPLILFRVTNLTSGFVPK
ncbi:non-specific serine/threonine protein kinase [Trifolium repens]|nr:non-specific serine/threonine protein kinase [Trifolium repens]